MIEKLVIVNVGSVTCGQLFSTSCNGIQIDWGEWYFEQPLNGCRDINLFTVGGYPLGNVRITPYSFEEKPKTKIPVFIQEKQGFNKGEWVELTENFQFNPKTHGFEIKVNDIHISAGCDDSDQPFKLIHYKGETSPFGETVEEWISPYIKTPNRPYVIWESNPNRRIYAPLPGR